MQAAPLRFLHAALWPLSIWASLTHFDDHPADDYVERTSPIVATAIGFWVCVAIIAAVVISSGGVFSISGEDGGASVHAVRRVGESAIDALWIILPVLYLIGFWLFAAREALYTKR